MAEAVFRRPWDDRQARPRRYSRPTPAARRAWPSARTAERLTALQNFNPAFNVAVSHRRWNGQFAQATSFQPGAGPLVIAGLAPLASENASVGPGAAALILSGYAP